MLDFPRSGHIYVLTLYFPYLSPAFSREHSIRLENAAVLKALFQSQLISDSVVMKCVPECLMRLCDTRGEIRAAYSALLEVVPTHVLTRYTYVRMYMYMYCNMYMYIRISSHVYTYNVSEHLGYCQFSVQINTVHPHLHVLRSNMRLS